MAKEFHSAKVAVITDSHFSNNFSYGTYENGVNNRIVEISDIHINFVKKCIEKGVRYIFHGGDLFHTFKPTPLEIGYATRWIALAVENGIEIVLMAGNHDYNFIQSALQIYDNSILINEKLSVLNTWELYEVDDTPIFCLPFVEPVKINEDFEKIKNIIAGLPKEGLVLGHVMTDNCIPGIERTFNEREPIIFSSEFLSDCVEAEILFGHIHDRQRFFLGSPIQLEFGEVSQKFFWTGNKGNEGEFTSIDQTRFVKYEVDISKIENYLEDFQNFVRTNDGFHDDSFLWFNVINADFQFTLNINEIKEIIPFNWKLVKHRINRQEETNTSERKAELGKEFTLMDTLKDFQKQHGYENTLQSLLEKRLLDEES